MAKMQLQTLLVVDSSLFNLILSFLGNDELISVQVTCVKFATHLLHLLNRKWESSIVFHRSNLHRRLETVYILFLTFVQHYNGIRSRNMATPHFFKVIF